MPRLLFVVVPALLVLALAACGSLLSRSSASSLPREGRVSWVVDGDTVHVAAGGREYKVRIIGLDAPEVAHGPGQRAACGGDDATRRLVQLAKGQRVRLTPQVEAHDRYGRWLADVRVLSGPFAGRDVATTLVSQGDARTLSIAPNVFHAVALQRLERAARIHARGLWGHCRFEQAYPGKRPDAPVAVR